MSSKAVNASQNGASFVYTGLLAMNLRTPAPAQLSR